MQGMNTKKYFEIRLSVIQILLSLFALIGCFFFAFTLGAFMGSRFMQSFSTPPVPPPRPTMMTDPPVADYGSFEPLNQPSGDSGKTASDLTFYETLPQKVEMSPAPMKEKATPQTEAPAEPSASTLAADAPSGSPHLVTRYTIQVAAFLQKEKAYALANTLISQGHHAQVVSKTDQKGETWHRVRVGSFTTPAEAKRQLSELSQLASQPRITPAE
jgi:cell division protein FtsN